MKTKAIIAGGVVAVLLLAAIVFITARPSSQDITVRHLGSLPSSNWLSMTFEVTNRTSHPYLLTPLEVEVRNGSIWRRAYKIKFFAPQEAGACAALVFSCQTTNLPVGIPLRFKMRGRKTLTGFDGFIRRMELNLRGTGSPVSLNPFDKRIKVYGSPIEIVSDDFIEPESK